jgi:hypothetical protein
VNIHFRKYLDSIKKKVPEISEKELSYFSNLLDVKTLKKNDYYIEVGQVQKYIGFLRRDFFAPIISTKKEMRKQSGLLMNMVSLPITHHFSIRRKANTILNVWRILPWLIYLTVPFKKFIRRLPHFKNTVALLPKKF